MSEKARAFEPKVDHLAKKALAKWSREELTRIRNDNPKLAENKDKLAKLLSERAASKALALCLDQPKMLVSASYPLLSVRPEDNESILSALPLRLEIQETWLFYEDQSALLICVPSEETRATARFFSELAEAPHMMSAVGLDPELVSDMGNLISMANMKRHILPLSPEEFKDLIAQRLSQSFPAGAEPCYWINLSERAVSQKEMLAGLQKACEAGIDTAAEAMKAKIAQLAADQTEQA